MYQAKANRAALQAVFCALFGIIFSALASPAYRLIYNASDSVPRGWYWVRPAERLPIGALVLVRLPDAARQLADQRGYLPKSVPALKRIVATTGDRVCERLGRVTINGQSLARARARDGAGRLLTPWSGCRTLRNGELFLLNSSSGSSYDSRYFGPIDRSQVVGVTAPLWTWS